jgi:antitoxin PrlF
VAEIQIHGQGRVTLPQEVRSRLDLQEGDLLEIEVLQDTILLHPKKLADTNQAYFWSDAWQAGEQRASQDITEGRTQAFPDAEATVAYLRAEAARQHDR